MSKSLSKNVLISLMNTFVSMVFPLITYPYIARVLQVENIGAINFGNSIVDYFSVLASFGISSFAVRTGAAIKDDKEKFRIFASQMFSLNIITTIISITALLIFLLCPTKVSVYREIILIQSIVLIAAPITLEWIYAIFEDFFYIAVRNLIVKLISLLAVFAFVKSQNDTLIYAFIISISTLVASLINLSHSRKYIRLRFTLKTGWSEYKVALSIFLFNSIASTIYLNSDKTMLGLFCDDTSVGLYTTATNIYMIVKRIVAAGILVIIPRLSYLFHNNRDEFESLVSKAVRIIFIICLPISAGLMLLSQDVIYLISGKGYEDANGPLRILSIAIIFAVLANLYASGVLISKNKEKQVMKCTLISSLVNISLNFLCIPFLKEIGTAITTLISEMIMAIMAIKYAGSFKTINTSKKTIGISLISTLIMSAVCYLCSTFIFADWYIILRMVLTIIISIIIFFTVEIVLKEKIVIEGLRRIFRL